MPQTPSSPLQYLLPSVRALFDIDAPPSLFHYTSQRGALGIIESGSIWASDVRYLNDASEFGFGLNCFKGLHKSRTLPESVSRIIDYLSATVQIDNEQVYGAASFSAKANDTAQWLSYGDNLRGICLEFDGNRLRSTASRSGAVLVRALYTADERDSLLDRFRLEVSELQRENTTDVDRILLTSVTVLCMLLKDPGFSHEDEYRLVSLGPLAGRQQQIFVREGRQSLVPYVKIPICGDEHLDRYAAEGDPNANSTMPLLATWCAQSPHESLAQAAMRFATRRFGIHATPKVASTPVRSSL